MPMSDVHRSYTRRASGVLWALVAMVVAAVALPIAPAGAAGPGPIAVVPYSGYNPLLTRAPYLTDLTQTSVDVTWATTSSVAGAVEWGPTGSCTAHSTPVPSTLPSLVPLSGSPASATARQFTVGTVSEYQSTVVLSGLAPGSTYCYRVLSGGVAPVDLLGANPSQSFTTLDAVGSTPSAPLTFDVVGDLGETQQSAGVEFPNSLNPDQAGDRLADRLFRGQVRVDRRRRRLRRGDTAELRRPAADRVRGQRHLRSVVLARDGWHPHLRRRRQPRPERQRSADLARVKHGGRLPGHLRLRQLSRCWPPTGRRRAPIRTPGTRSPPASPHLRAERRVGRRHRLSGNLGSATGSACGAVGSPAAIACEGYQVDHDEHWTPASPEYRWLAADLASHPGAVKMAVWHYPLRSDNGTQPSDNYLQNSAADPYQSTSLESLLSTNGVKLVFNGHAHTYQRIAPNAPGQVVNYVTGGGGGVLEPVLGGSVCTGLQKVEAIYAIGWSPSSGSGSGCGAPAPQSAAQVYNFLKVTVSGNTVTVTPTNAAGQVFDQQTYTYSLPSPPTVPTGVTAATAGSAVALTWAPSVASTGVIASYQVSRNGIPLTTVAGTVTGLTDAQVQPGGTYSYSVTAVDSAGNTSAPGASNQVTVPLLTTGFESGSLSGWSPVVGGVSVQSQAVHSGTFAAQVTSTGGQSFLLQNLPAASSTLYAQGWFDVASQSTSTTLLGLRTQATSSAPAVQVADVYLSVNGQVKLRNNISATNYLGTQTLAPGTWHG